MTERKALQALDKNTLQAGERATPQKRKKKDGSGSTSSKKASFASRKTPKISNCATAAHPSPHGKPPIATQGGGRKKKSFVTTRRRRTAASPAFTSQEELGRPTEQGETTDANNASTTQVQEKTQSDPNVTDGRVIEASHISKTQPNEIEGGSQRNEKVSPASASVSLESLRCNLKGSFETKDATPVDDTKIVEILHEEMDTSSDTESIYSVSPPPEKDVNVEFRRAHSTAEDDRKTPQDKRFPTTQSFPKGLPKRDTQFVANNGALSPEQIDVLRNQPADNEAVFRLVMGDEPKQKHNPDAAGLVGAVIGGDSLRRSESLDESEITTSALTEMKKRKLYDNILPLAIRNRAWKDRPDSDILQHAARYGNVRCRVMDDFPLEVGGTVEEWSLPEDDLSSTSSILFRQGGRKYIHPSVPQGWNVVFRDHDEKLIYVRPNQKETPTCPVELPSKLEAQTLRITKVGKQKGHNVEVFFEPKTPYKDYTGSRSSTLKQIGAEAESVDSSMSSLLCRNGLEDTFQTNATSFDDARRRDKYDSYIASLHARSTPSDTETNHEGIAGSRAVTLPASSRCLTASFRKTRRLPGAGMIQQTIYEEASQEGSPILSTPKACLQSHPYNFSSTPVQAGTMASGEKTPHGRSAMPTGTKDRALQSAFKRLRGLTLSSPGLLHHDIPPAEQSRGISKAYVSSYNSEPNFATIANSKPFGYDKVLSRDHKDKNTLSSELSTPGYARPSKYETPIAATQANSRARGPETATDAVVDMHSIRFEASPHSIRGASKKISSPLEDRVRKRASPGQAQGRRPDCHVPLTADAGLEEPSCFPNSAPAQVPTPRKREKIRLAKTAMPTRTEDSVLKSASRRFRGLKLGTPCSMRTDRPTPAQGAAISTTDESNCEATPKLAATGSNKRSIRRRQLLTRNDKGSYTPTLRTFKLDPPKRSGSVVPGGGANPSMAPLEGDINDVEAAPSTLLQEQRIGQSTAENQPNHEVAGNREIRMATPGKADLFSTPKTRQESRGVEETASRPNFAKKLSTQITAQTVVQELVGISAQSKARSSSVRVYSAIPKTKLLKIPASRQLPSRRQQKCSPKDESKERARQCSLDVDDHSDYEDETSPFAHVQTPHKPTPAPCSRSVEKVTPRLPSTGTLGRKNENDTVLPSSDRKPRSLVVKELADQGKARSDEEKSGRKNHGRHSEFESQNVSCKVTVHPETPSKKQSASGLMTTRDTRSSSIGELDPAKSLPIEGEWKSAGFSGIASCGGSDEESPLRVGMESAQMSSGASDEESPLVAVESTPVRRRPPKVGSFSAVDGAEASRAWQSATSTVSRSCQVFSQEPSSDPAGVHVATKKLAQVDADGSDHDIDFGSGAHESSDEEESLTAADTFIKSKEKVVAGARCTHTQQEVLDDARSEDSAGALRDREECAAVSVCGSTQTRGSIDFYHEDDSVASPAGSPDSPSQGSLAGDIVSGSVQTRRRVDSPDEDDSIESLKSQSDESSLDDTDCGSTRRRICFDDEDCSIETATRKRKGMGWRVLNPPHPLCSLQRLDSLPRRQIRKKRTARSKASKASRKSQKQQRGKPRRNVGRKQQQGQRGRAKRRY